MNATTPTAQEIEALLAPMLLCPLPGRAYEQFGEYLKLLYRWNQRMNLTAVRGPWIMASLHLGESVRCAQLLPKTVRTVLDFGSGAGLPGIPIQIARPELAVTLAESQIKKASFLREAVRALGLTHTTVHAGRVNDLPNCSTWNNLNSGFDAVSLRAVDRMGRALADAEQCLREGGWMAVLTSASQAKDVEERASEIEWGKAEAIPGSNQRVLLLGRKANGDTP